MSAFLLVASTQPPFDGLDAIGGRIVDAEIDQRRQRVGCQRDTGGAGDGLGGEHQLRHTQDGADGGFLHHGDHLVGQRRQDVLHRLRQHHQTHTLPFGEAQRTGGLRLSLIHGQNTGTENFRHIGRTIQGQRHHAGDEAADIHEAEEGQPGQGDGVEQAVVDDGQLHQHGGGAEHGDVGPGEPAHRLFRLRRMRASPNAGRMASSTDTTASSRVYSMPRTKAVPYLGRKEKLKKSVGSMSVNRSLHHMGVISFQMEEYPALGPPGGPGGPPGGGGWGEYW